MKNGQHPDEPEDYTTVEITLDVSRGGWEMAERFAALMGVEPLRLIDQAVEQRLHLFAWLMDRANRKVAS